MATEVAQLKGGNIKGLHQKRKREKPQEKKRKQKRKKDHRRLNNGLRHRQQRIIQRGMKQSSAVSSCSGALPSQSCAERSQIGRGRFCRRQRCRK